MPIFNRMSLKQAFEILIGRKIVASEFHQASKTINKLKGNDWRLWFGRFLLFVRSDAKNSRFRDAYMCLTEAENLINTSKKPQDKKEFFELINNESLFLEFKFYFDATGIPAAALYLSRAYLHGWGVKPDFKKALEMAKIGADINKDDPLFPMAEELLKWLKTEIKE